MKAEVFDALSNEEKIDHLSEMASLASYDKFSNTKSSKKDKKSSEDMPGRHTELIPTSMGLFEEEG